MEVCNHHVALDALGGVALIAVVARTDGGEPAARAEAVGAACGAQMRHQQPHALPVVHVACYAASSGARVSCTVIAFTFCATNSAARSPCVAPTPSTMACFICLVPKVCFFTSASFALTTLA